MDFLRNTGEGRVKINGLFFFKVRGFFDKDKPNLGNNCLIVYTLHLEKWILHRLVQLYAYRDLLKNLFANSVVFFCIFQWTNSKFYSQPTSYVFLVYVKSVFQPVFANHSIDRVLGILSCRRNWDPPPSHTGEGAPPPRFWREGYTNWRERRWGGGPNTNEGTDTVLL